MPVAFSVTRSPEQMIHIAAAEPKSRASLRGPRPAEARQNAQYSERRRPGRPLILTNDRSLVRYRPIDRGGFLLSVLNELLRGRRLQRRLFSSFLRRDMTKTAVLWDFHPNERLALFIDGANLYATSKSLGIDIDYKRLLHFFREKTRLIRASYYTALADDQEFSSVRPLVDWLDYNGFTMVTKPVKEFLDASGRRKFKGNMDMELAVDAMRLANNVDHLVIFSGDGDFRSLVSALQTMGKRVSVVSTLQTQPPMVADELRRQADQFIDLADLKQEIGRRETQGQQRHPIKKPV